jgi:sugar/nucleoside kinase (ribokinase family)
MVVDPLAATVTTLAAWARGRHVGLSVDASSVALVDEIGVEAVRRIVAGLAPDILFANADEAAVLGLTADAPPLAPTTVVKRGPDPALLLVTGAEPAEVAVPSIGPVADSTGAGDAFAAGFLVDRDPGGRATWRVDPVAATRAGHAAAGELLAARQL